MAAGGFRPAAALVSRSPLLLLLLLVLLLSRPAAGGCPSVCSCRQDAVVCPDTRQTANITEL